VPGEWDLVASILWSRVRNIAARLLQGDQFLIDRFSGTRRLAVLTRPHRVAAIFVAPELHDVKMWSTNSRIFLRGFLKLAQGHSQTECPCGAFMAAAEIESET
jgi:hypothetical protein